MPRRRIAAAALAALLAGGCGGSEPRAPSAQTATPTPAATAGACDAARPRKPVEAPKGLVMPRGTLVAEVASVPPNTRATGFMPLEPDAFVRVMERRRGLGILFKESEGHEAEVLVTDARQRSFWKVVRTCPGGSAFAVLTGEETQPAAAREAIRAGRG